MAQITISEEHYRALIELAQSEGTTPDALADRIIEDQLIAADQRAFWGEDIDQVIAERLRAVESGPRRILTDEEFIADLRSRMDNSDDASST
jgi:hypothetical protein